MAEYATHWVFTAFTDEKSVPKPDLVKVRYCVWQREVCPETKKEHWQGYVELYRNARRAGAQKALGFPKGVHFEKRRGTREEAKAYCMKEETRKVGSNSGPFEAGTWNLEPGKRTDLERAVKCKNMAEVKLECPTAYVKYFKGLTKLLEPTPVYGHKPEVWILWGEGTGTGKSRSVKSLAEEKLFSMYTKDNSTAWWDGYDGQDVTLIDEFSRDGNHAWLTAGVFTTLFDYGPSYVWQKGETRKQFLSKYVMITSNKNPRDWFEGRWEIYQRRITKIIYCGDVDNDCKDRLSDLRAIRTLEMRQKLLEDLVFEE